MKHFAILLAWVLIAAMPALGQKFLRDDPVWEDHDRLPIPPPAEIELSQLADVLQNTFLYRPEDKIPAAQNVNTLGEVPDSSWFTNRLGRHPMTVREVARGPNRHDGPDLSVPWEILSVKAEGLTPGLRMRDGRGDTYFIKFDPYDYPQMATSSEVICTKFFHAFGYHVPENYLAFLDPDDFRISSDAEIEDHDRMRPLTRRDLEFLLSRVRRRRDGTIQVMASKVLPGDPLGPFTYWKTRSDDPNDIFGHEDRRELRGLRLFAAWLNHDDARSVNSLDTYIEDGSGGYIRHHLVDFGSCLGSGSVIPQNPRAGHEYIFEWEPIWKAALTLGLRDRSWREIPYPRFPAIGNFEGDFFKPEMWKPEYPNPAFERMLPEDALWAARIIQRFSDDMVRAIVRTGRLDDSRAEEYLVRTLIQRRDKILRHYLAQLSPLGDFRVRDETGGGSTAVVEFENTGVQAGLVESVSYEYRWYRFDNVTEETEPLGPLHQTRDGSIPLPEDPDAYLMLRIRTQADAFPQWERPVDVYLRSLSGIIEVVGIER